MLKDGRNEPNHCLVLQHCRRPFCGSRLPFLQQMSVTGEDVAESERCVLGFRFLETQVLSSIISLLHTLWVTNLGDKGVEWGSQPPRQSGPQEPPKLLALHLVNEFLYVLTVLTKHLR